MVLVTIFAHSPIWLFIIFNLFCVWVVVLSYTFRVWAPYLNIFCIFSVGYLFILLIIEEATLFLFHCLRTLVNFIWPCIHEFTWGSLFWSLGLCICFYASIIQLFSYNFVMCLEIRRGETLIFVLKIILSICSLQWFHISFWICFSISMKMMLIFWLVLQWIFT